MPDLAVASTIDYRMTSAGREPSPEHDDRRPLAPGFTAASRDAAQHRLARLRGRLIVGLIGLTGALSVVAAQAFPGKAVSRSASSGPPSTSTAPDTAAAAAAAAASTPAPVAPPDANPQAVQPAGPVAMMPAVVSGGS